MFYTKDRNKSFRWVVFFMLGLTLSHVYPLIQFLTGLIVLIISHFLKRYKTRNYVGMFLFLCYPCVFYLYLYCFVNAVMSDGNILLQTYESPYYIKMNMESWSFWILRFSVVSTIQCPLLSFKLNAVYFKQFLFETFYFLAVICDVTGLSFSIKIF